MSNYHTNEIERFAEIFKALSNPNRLQIFLRLIDCCKPGTVCCTANEIPNCVGELGKDLGIAPSTVSHHIKELRRSGLITVTRRGQLQECSVDVSVLPEILQLFTT